MKRDHLTSVNTKTHCSYCYLVLYARSIVADILQDIYQKGQILTRSRFTFLAPFYDCAYRLDCPPAIPPPFQLHQQLTPLY